MAKAPLKVLAIGATGSIGRHVVSEVLQRGHSVRALVREPRAVQLPPTVEIVIGDLTKPETLAAAVAGVDAIVFTHGANGGGKAAEAVDYGGVRNVLVALGGRKVRIALMTAIGVTDHATEAHDWKRRGERLVRASGCPYTIVRPGWFDYNAADQHRLVLLQGDRRQSGTPRDGVIARRQIAEVLVRSLVSEAANRKTFELVAERGTQQDDLEALFSVVKPDTQASTDGVGDQQNMPLDKEPKRVLDDLQALNASDTKAQ
jgi:uncharacterized protein YbjT (DUF2867 family)